MRTINSNLQQEILNGSIANCIKITLANGTVHAYTDHNHNLTVGGVTYVPAPGLRKVNYILTSNAEVSNQQFGSAWVDAPESELRGGLFDQALVEVSYASWKHPEFGKLVTFTGQLGEITWSEAGFSADIVSFMKNLAKNVGAVFTSSCRHTMYGDSGPGFVGGCKVDPASFTFSGTVSSILTPKWRFNTSPLDKPDGYFSNGSITFTSGLNTGLSTVIKKHTGTLFELFLPTAFIIDPAATFTVRAGCDKTLNTCKNTFNNVVNYGGFPHIRPDVSFQ